MRVQASFDCDLCNQQSDECHALAHIKSEIQQVDNGMVLIAIPLDKNQFDLAVDKALVEQVRYYLTDQSYLRLSSSDPLFAAEYGRSYLETTFHALTRVISRYNEAASSVYMTNDPRCINWFVAENNRLGMLLQDYRKQIEYL